PDVLAAVGGRHVQRDQAVAEVGGQRRREGDGGAGVGHRLHRDAGGAEGVGDLDQVARAEEAADVLQDDTRGDGGAVGDDGGEADALGAVEGVQLRVGGVLAVALLQRHGGAGGVAGGGAAGGEGDVGRGHRGQLHRVHDRALREHERVAHAQL